MVEYKEFRVGDLFEPVLNTSRTLQKQETGEYPLVCGSGVNNGRDGFTDVSDVVYENEITISTRGSSGSTFYQKGPFVLNNNAMVLKAKFEKRHRVLLYIARNIGSLGYNGYQHYPTKRGIVDDLILLPATPQGQPDFDFMENYIKEIEQKHVKKLESDLATRTENLLTVIGREDLVGDPDGLAAVVDKGFDDSGVKYAEFRVGDLFDKAQTRYLGEGKAKDALIRGPISSGEHTLPITYAKIEDNGIMYWGVPDEWEYAENVIGVVYNGAVSAGLVYPHKKAAVLAESYLLKLKIDNGHLPFAVYKYMATVLGKTTYQIYSREFLATWSGKVENDVITLPTTPFGQPDFKFMEQYIAHIELKFILTDAMVESERIAITKELVE